LRVGFLGAFSIDNAGDHLIARATRQAIRARTTCDEIVLAPDLPQPGWRHDWSAARGGGVEIRRVPPNRASTVTSDLDALIIGGGGILLPHAGFHPYVAWGSVPAAWNAICSQNTSHTDPTLSVWYGRVRSACERLRYTSVRNATTEQLLRSCGVTTPIALVPDVAVGYVPDHDAETDIQLDALLARGDRPVIGLSAGTAFPADWLATLDRLAAAKTFDLVVFGFGRVYGDDETARNVLGRLPHARAIDASLSADALWRLIGKLDAYLCTRFHAVIAAYVQGVPFLVCDEYTSTAGTSKIREFLVERGLEAARVVPGDVEPFEPRIQALLAQHRTEPTTLVADRAALAKHYDAMLAALMSR